MSKNLEEKFRSFCNSKNLEINQNQIETIKLLQDFYNKNFHSSIFNIFKKENISFDDGAIDLLVELAGGSIRDSITLADQAAFQCNNNITEAEMSKFHGLIDKSSVDKLLSDKKIQKALKAGTNLRDVKDRVDSIMGTKGEYQEESITSKLKKEFKQYDNINKNLTRG